jgi:hypothetical protein
MGETTRVDRQAVGFLIYLLVILGLGDLLFCLLHMWGGSHRLDFSIYWECAVAMRRGLDPYAIDLTALGRELHLQAAPFPHPGDTPTFILASAPLAMFSARTAYALWTLASVLFLGASLFLLFGPSARLERKTALYFSLATLAFTPLARNLMFSQTQTFVVFGVLIFYRLLQRKRAGWAGTLLAALGLLRGYPLVMGGYLIVRRQWRAIGVLALAFAAGAVATVMLMGVGPVENYLHTSGIIGGNEWLSVAPWLLNAPLNYSLDAFVTRPMMLLFGVNLSAGARMIRLAIVVAGDLAILISTFRATAGASDDRCLALWTATMLILTPVIWVHYVTVLIIPFALIAVAAVHRQTSVQVWRFALRSYCFLVLVTPLFMRLSFHRSFSDWRISVLSELGFPAVLSAWIAARRFATEAAKNAGPLLTSS